MPGPIDPSIRLKRLETLADLWGKVYLFHPAIITPSPLRPSPNGRGEQGEGAGLDWNQALIRATPRVEAAETPDDLANAINEELLQPLGDPLTFAEVQGDRAIEGSRDRADEGEFEARRLTDSIGYVRVPPPSSRGPGFLVDFQTAVERLGAVEKLVVDLRWPTASGQRMNDPVLRFFVRTALVTGPVMNRVHEGWSEDNGLGAYRQKWEVIGGAGLHPIQEADWYLAALCPGTDFTRLRTITTPSVFLVNRPSATSYHKVLDALQSQPGIAVVLESSGPPEEAPPLRLEYPEGLVVQLNTERLVGHDGNAGFCPDLVVDKKIGQTQLAAVAEQALLKASSPKPQASSRESAAGLMNLRLPAPLSETGGSLTREERLLGLFRVWNVIRYVYPHLEFCDMDWHSCLPEWIPRIERADSPVAYVRTLRMLTAHLHDNNIFYYFPGLPEPQALPVGFGWVEGKIVVTDVIEGAESYEARSERLEARAQTGRTRGLGDAETPRLEVGDELVEFDGKTVPDLIAEHRLQFSYSTEGAFHRHMAEMLGFGTAGAEVKLVFRRKMGTVLGENGDAPKMGTVPGSRTGPCEGTVPILHMTLTLKRTVTREAWVAHLARKRQSRGYRLLEGNLGYLDLGRLSSLEEFDHAFEVLGQANGLIIDIRGYPGFMVQLALSARLSERPVKSAVFEIPVVSGIARLEQGWNSGQYEVQPDPKKHYSGPVVVLINEKTFGGSEDICIYLKNAGRVTFVGGTTAGCNGNRTWLSLPGGGRLWFTGMRVKFGDGSRFQNIGIVPDVPVAPTVDGIRAGRDEVLEKAVQVLEEKVRGQGSKDQKTKDEGQSDKGRRAR